MTKPYGYDAVEGTAELRRQIVALGERVSEVMEENKQLRTLLHGSDLFDWRFLGLTPTEGRLVMILMHRATASHEFLYEATRGARKRSESADPARLISSYVARLNAKLVQSEVWVDSLWGSGYFLNPDNRERLRRLRDAQENKGVVVGTGGVGDAGVSVTPSPSPPAGAGAGSTEKL